MKSNEEKPKIIVNGQIQTETIKKAKLSDKGLSLNKIMKDKESANGQGT